MGLILSSLGQWLWLSPTERRILMLGLDGAGKTTILYKLKVTRVHNRIGISSFFR